MVTFNNASSPHDLLFLQSFKEVNKHITYYLQYLHERKKYCIPVPTLPPLNIFLYLMIMLIEAHLNIHPHKFTKMTMSVGVLGTEHCRS